MTNFESEGGRRASLVKAESSSSASVEFRKPRQQERAFPGSGDLFGHSCGGVQMVRKWTNNGAEGAMETVGKVWIVPKQESPTALW